MSAAAQTHGWDKPSRRRVPRFLVRVPLDVTILRSGIQYTLPGRLVNLCERGLGAVLAGEVLPDEAVGVEVRLPLAADPLRTRALVRHYDRLQCGVEFIGLSAEQQALIRQWAEQSKPEPEPEVLKTSVSETEDQGGGTRDLPGPGTPEKPNRTRRGGVWTTLVVLAAILAAAFWWRWNRAWEELESGLPDHGAASAVQPRVQVPAEVMEKLLVHKVEPDYPDAARKAKLQGIVVLEIVVGRDGSVVGIRPMNGPEVLAQSAMDALRWWKFEPYRVNGEPTVVETTVAVEFKP
jgi:TonB family protein